MVLAQKLGHNLLHKGGKKGGGGRKKSGKKEERARKSCYNECGQITKVRYPFILCYLPSMKTYQAPFTFRAANSTPV